MISNEKVNIVRVNGVNTAGQTAVSDVKGNGVTAVKASAGFIVFGGSARGGKITGKGKIRTDKLDFEDVFFVKELKFNLFSVSQMCDKKNSVLFSLELQDKKELTIPGQTATGKEFSNPLMAGSLPKTITCLEKSDENAEFHQIVDFLSTCSINYALTVSPTIYASYIEQFWNTATSKIINSVKQIHAIVDGKAVVISESSVRSDLLFNDEDGVTCLTNDEIFENLALMGYEQLSTKLTFQKGNITPLFASMLVQNQAPEGEGSAVHPEPQPTPSTSQPNVSEPQIASLHIETSPTAAPKLKHTKLQYLKFSHLQLLIKEKERLKNVAVPGAKTQGGGYTPGSDEGRMTLDELITLCTQLSKQVLDLEKENDAQAVEILNLKKLERKRKSSISHPRRRKYRQVKTSSDDDLDEEDASKQGRRSDKLKPMFKDKDFEELDDHIENVEEETVDAAATGVSIVSAPVSTAGVTISTAEPRTPPTTTTVFDDEDVTMAMAQTLIKMKEQKAKEKGVAITDVEDSSRIVRPVRSITTLQPLPTIDPKDKGKGVLVEEEPVKIKMRDQGDLQVQADAELAQRLHEEELAELERAQQERQRQEDDTNAALAKEFDEIQAKIDADHELAQQEQSNKKQTTYKNSSQEQDDYLPQAYGEKKVDSSSKPAGGSRKKTLAKKRAGEKKSEESAKKKKLEDVAEEQESAKNEEETVDPKILSAKYPIVDRESHNLENVDMEDLHVYKIIRADGNTSYHKSLSSMLKKFDRQDLVDLHRLVMRRFEDTTLEGNDGRKILNWKLEAELEHNGI
ncbi:hypothetical protein Tco_0902529 [Tanacetum coccineum]